MASDFAFAGRLWDNDTGLYYNRARWYDSNTGRFLSEDPIGFAGGDSNLYRYAGNDPVNFRDPSGLTQAGNPIRDIEKRLLLQTVPFQTDINALVQARNAQDNQIHSQISVLKSGSFINAIEQMQTLTRQRSQFDQEIFRRLNAFHEFSRSATDPLRHKRGSFATTQMIFNVGGDGAIASIGNLAHGTVQDDCKVTSQESNRLQC